MKAVRGMRSGSLDTTLAKSSEDETARTAVREPLMLSMDIPAVRLSFVSVAVR